MQIVDEWLRDMPQQFLGKHNIEVLVSAFAKQLQELDWLYKDLVSITDIDVATGQNLDYVGTIIPLTRKEAGELAGINVEDPVISDERYRQFLRYQNLVNTNECTYYDLMNGLALLWDVSPIYYIEDPDMPATIILTMPFMKPGGEVVTVGEVPMVKPGGVRIEFQYLVRYSVEVLVKWIYQIYGVPLCNQIRCGQHPRPGSLGQITLIQTNIDIDEIRFIFETTKTGTITVGGKAYDSTKGEIITEDVYVTIDSDYNVTEVNLAGQTLSGTVPHSAVNGVMIGSSIEAYKVVTNATNKLPMSGTLIIGGKAEEPALIVENETVSIEPIVHIATANVRRCGTGACGK